MMELVMKTSSYASTANFNVLQPHRLGLPLTQIAE